MKYKDILRKTAYLLSAVILIITAVFSLYKRVSVYTNKDKMAVMAAALTMSKGSYNLNYNKNKKRIKKAAEKPASENDTKPPTPTTSSAFSEKYYNTFSSHSGKKKYPIYSKQYRVGGERYDNFYVKNNTNYNLDIGSVLKKNLDFKITKSDDVQVLIYHTHTSESYIDCDVGYYYSDFYPRTKDSRYNVVRIGDVIKNELEKSGIKTLHDKTYHDDVYTGSYLRSRKTVENCIKKHPKIKVTLDIHRDSIGSDTYKMKPTFTYKGKKGAQIMILTGYDPNGYFNFPKWNYNLRFALKLQKECETKFRGMTRPLDFGNFAYNMNVNTGSLLIEVGAEGNTLEEAEYSGKLLAKALTEVLQNSD